MAKIRVYLNEGSHESKYASFVALRFYPKITLDRHSFGSAPSVEPDILRSYRSDHVGRSGGSRPGMAKGQFQIRRPACGNPEGGRPSQSRRPLPSRLAIPANLPSTGLV